MKGCFVRGCAALLLVLCAPFATAQVNALPSLPHLLVKGEASRDVVPDRFTVSITLSALDMQPEVARERVQTNLGALLNGLKSGGAIADSIEETLGDELGRSAKIEGTPDTGWVLLDYGSLIVHIFYDFVRQEYRLEELWRNSKDLGIKDPLAP